MAGHKLTQRVSDLEERFDPPAPAKWHWIVSDLDETAEQAQARYETEHGAIAPNENIIRWTFPQ